MLQTTDQKYQTDPEYPDVEDVMPRDPTVCRSNGGSTTYTPIGIDQTDYRIPQTTDPEHPEVDDLVPVNPTTNDSKTDSPHPRQRRMVTEPTAPPLEKRI
ncbi:MAG: hypothetical protein QF632_06655 [Candidatus Woesearchaeota archaeon]|jgi:hypothetical protein|nr:hypothetical protein [Candidatus Woesearchaeota archaeon]MDP7458046.1 hypothetical protein [Candidatus Woesearchaeota archaeon]|tara:strand:+ start:591 stop:890 length:300 start_codon:yes stop_codon:yes gene_type:complete